MVVSSVIGRAAVRRTGASTVVIAAVGDSIGREARESVVPSAEGGVRLSAGPSGGAAFPTLRW